MREDEYITITTHTTRKGFQVTRRKYGFFNFMFDVVLTCVTGGLWLIWIFVREMRNR